MSTITANIPARKVGKQSFPARVDVFEQDDAGQWVLVDADIGLMQMREADVVEICQRATNWAEIKAAHFPMVGFHN